MSKPKGLHPTHKTRIAWGASTYDEICTRCGATDEVPGGWGRLALPCPEANVVDKLAELAEDDEAAAPEKKRRG